MGYYRVTYEGYAEGEFDSSEAAKEDFIQRIRDDELDQYGRGWTALVSVEEFNEETNEWE